MPSEMMIVPVELAEGPEVDVEVYFSIQPPEPENRHYGWGIELEQIKYQGTDILHAISATDLEHISQWVISRITEKWEN